MNVHGAGVRSPAALPIATPIRVETADHRTATGWVTDFEPLGHEAKWWLLGIALEQPSNFWGVPTPPENWLGHLPPIEPPSPDDPQRKFSVWPGAYGPESKDSAEASRLALVSTADVADRPMPEVAAGLQAADGADPGLLWSRLEAELEQRTEQHWSRFRNQLEPQLLASTQALQQELQDSLAAWREERAAVEGKLQELLTVRDDVSTRLGSIDGLLRQQSAPLREEIIAQARQQVDKLIRDFQEQLRGEHESHETVKKLAAAAVEQQIQAHTDSLLHQVRESSAAEIAALASGSMDRLEQQLQAKLGQAAEKIQAELISHIQQQQQAASQAVTGQMAELRASETGVRDHMKLLSEELTAQSEQALAQLRVQVQELGEKQEQELSERLKKRDAASQSALHSLGGRILASAKGELKAELERQQQKAAGSHQSLRAEIDHLEKHAAELESRLTEVREAREYVESLSKDLRETIQQRVSETVTRIIGEMSSPAHEQFTQRVQAEITTLEQRVQEVAEQVGATFSAKLGADFAQRHEHWQSGLAELEAKAAAILDEASRISKSFEQQRQTFFDSANATLNELTARDNGLQQTFKSLSQTVDAKKEEILAAAQSGVEHTRDAETRLRITTDEMTAGLDARAQQSLELLKASVQGMVSEREQQLRALVAQSHKEAELMLQQRAAVAAAAVQQQLQQEFERRQQAFEQARASAVQQLDSLQHRAEKLVSIVDVELQKHADDLVGETVSEAAERLQEASNEVHKVHLARTQAELQALVDGKLKKEGGELLTKAVSAAGQQFQEAANRTHRDHLSRVQAELDRLLAAVVQQASDAGAELRRTVAGVQQELAQTRLDSAAIRSQVEAAQASLAQQTEQFQSTLHDAFLQAASEIKGRIHQAVEMAEEPLDRHSRDIQAQLSAAAQRMTDELQKQFADARDRLQAVATSAGSNAEQALQQRLENATEAFRKDAENLARRSLERWQAAVSETLADIPKLLSNKLRAE